MLVKDKQGDVIAGCFYSVNQGTALVRYLGVIDGDFGLVRKGAESAIYNFFVVHPEDPGVRAANFGGARPFFHDGLFWYKQKWGMTVSVSEIVTEVFGFKMTGDKESIKKFLIQNPFLGVTTKEELIGYVFVDTDSFTDAVGGDLEKRYQTPGITGFRFIRL